MPVDPGVLGAVLIVVVLVAVAAVLGRLAARFFLRASADRAGRR